MRMAAGDPQQAAQMLEAALRPWYEALAGPARAHEVVLHRFLAGYAQTGYGARHGAAQIGSLADYRRAFPIATYEDMEPLIKQVMAGDVGLLLTEEPVGWAITRGTTGPDSKFIPMTPADLRMRVSAGRAVMNYGTSGARR